MTSQNPPQWKSKPKTYGKSSRASVYRLESVTPDTLPDRGKKSAPTKPPTSRMREHLTRDTHGNDRNRPNIYDIPSSDEDDVSSKGQPKSKFSPNIVARGVSTAVVPKDEVGSSKSTGFLHSKSLNQSKRVATASSPQKHSRLGSKYSTSKPFGLNRTPRKRKRGADVPQGMKSPVIYKHADANVKTQRTEDLSDDPSDLKYVLPDRFSIYSCISQHSLIASSSSLSSTRSPISLHDRSSLRDFDLVNYITLVTL